jgi:hypothetical protein
VQRGIARRIKGPSFRKIIPPEVVEIMERNCPLPFLSEPEDVAAVIAFSRRMRHAASPARCSVSTAEC